MAPESVIEIGDGAQINNNNNAFIKGEGRGSGSEPTRGSAPTSR
jgi:hypothetical protein